MTKINVDDDPTTAKPPKRSLYALIMTLCGVHGTIVFSNRINISYFSRASCLRMKRLIIYSSGMVILRLGGCTSIIPVLTKPAT